MKGRTAGDVGVIRVEGMTRRTVSATWAHVLVIAAAASAASCACANPRKTSGWDGTPPNTAAQESAAGSKLQRPVDLPADWNWSGQAIPTGDPSTSVIKLERFAPATVNVGSNCEYRVRVTNISKSVALSDIAVKDRLPGANFSFASADPPGERTGDQIAWNIGRLAPGESREVVVRGKAASVGPIGGSASVSYAPQVGVESTAVLATLKLEKFAPTEIVQCDEIPLRFVLTNSGNGAANHVKVVDQLPDGWTVNGGRTLTFEVATLKPGETKELKAVAKASKPGEFVDRATVTADNGIEVKAEAKTAVRVPKLELSREPNAAPGAGTDAVLKINVKNTGDGPARDLVIEDTIDGADRIVLASDGGVVTGKSVKWLLGTLAPGAIRSVSITVNRAAAGAVTETTKVTAYCAEAASGTSKTEYGPAK